MREQRDEALYQEFKRIWKENPQLTYDEVIDRVLVAPQPRMWVGFFGVYHRLKRILYSSRKGLINKAKLGLEDEVARKYERLKKMYIFRDASPYFLVSFIIAEPAIGFFVSKAYAKRIIWRTCKKHKNKSSCPKN